MRGNREAGKPMSNSQAGANIQYSPKAYVTHDALGTVISIGRVPLNFPCRVEVRPRNKTHAVLEVELNAEQESMSVLDLHKTHTLHVGQKKLIKK